MPVPVRKTLGGISWGIVVALLWQDEGRRMPFMLKIIAVPLAFLFAVWAFWPTIADYLALLKKPHSQLVGIEGHGRPSKLWPAVKLAVLGLLGAAPVFLAGMAYQDDGPPRASASLSAPSEELVSQRQRAGEAEAALAKANAKLLELRNQMDQTSFDLISAREWRRYWRAKAESLELKLKGETAPEVEPPITPDRTDRP